jgi:hypothetical protein
MVSLAMPNPQNWKNTPYHLSVAAYSMYWYLPSISLQLQTEDAPCCDYKGRTIISVFLFKKLEKCEVDKETA